SLAEDQGKWAAAVILSGGGSDGVGGVRAIKHNGGLVIAQDIVSATQTGMPSSIIDAGLADVILQPDEMPAAFLNHFEIDVDQELEPEDLIEHMSDDDVTLVI